MGRILQLIKRLIDKLFPISIQARILAAQFAMPDGYQALINTETKELTFAPTHMADSCMLALGGNPADIRLIVTKAGVLLINLATGDRLKMNFRERHLLKTAILDWAGMESTEFSVVNP